MSMINFLRGVPALEALEPVADAMAREYAHVMKEYGTSLIQYQTAGLTDFNGFIPLKQALAERYRVEGAPQKRVLCSNGGMETFSLLLKSFPKGSQIATEAMTYDRVLFDIGLQGHQAVGVPLGPDGVDLDSLRETLRYDDIKVFYQIAYHQSPTGLTTSIENMLRASELCAARNVLHVLDIAYFELRYDGQKNRLVDLGRFPATTCLVGSFTKTLSPGAKCGFGIFPEKILDQVSPVVANTRLNPNYPTQAAIRELMASGFYDEHVEFLAELYRPRMEAVNRAARTHLPDLAIPELTGGFFIGFWLPGISEEQPFIESTKAKGVLLAPAHVFAPGWEQHYFAIHQGIFFRLTFPAQTPEENERGIALIGETYRSMAG